MCHTANACYRSKVFMTCGDIFSTQMVLLTAWIRTAARRALVWPILCAVDHVTHSRSFSRANQRSRKSLPFMTESRCLWVKTALTLSQESTPSMPGTSSALWFDGLNDVVYHALILLFVFVCVCVQLGISNTRSGFDLRWHSFGRRQRDLCEVPSLWSHHDPPGWHVSKLKLFEPLWLLNMC